MAEPNWGEPPWQVDLPFQTRARPDFCEVAVVGAGFTGLAAAQALALAGKQVAVFEATRIGAGASGRSGGLVLEDTGAGVLPGVGDCIPALERLLVETDTDCDLELSGCFELHHCDERSPLWRDAERCGPAHTSAHRAEHF